jgi:hypothetical protein
MLDMQQRDTPIPWPIIVQLLAAIGSIAYFLPPLSSSRPPAPPSGTDTGSLGTQTVEARLWQEPFDAIEQRGAGRERVKPYGGLPALGNLLTREPCTTLLMVMVEGGPYSENIESRLRYRHAVVSALGTGVKRYVPEDGEHIGFVEDDEWPQRTSDPQTRPTSPTAVARSPKVRLAVPFEFWRPQYRTLEPKQNAEPVAVVWLREDRFEERPLLRLEMFLRRLNLPEEHTVNVVLLGPRGSTTLRQMIDEVAVDVASKAVPYALLSRVRVISPSATASEDVLTFAVPGWQGRKTWERSLGFKSFTRTTCTDKALSLALIRELGLRGISVGHAWPPLPSDNCASVADAMDDVALVAEWDTFYGRALPVTFAAAATGQSISDLAGPKPTSAPDGKKQAERWPPWIHRFSYLRGIDGQLPGEAAAGAGRSAAGAAASGARGNGGSRELTPLDFTRYTPRERPDPPEGRSGVDYLRRLVDDLLAVDRHARRRSVKQDGLRAVGIFGSDVYDKLLILRALREQLPGRVFFTTDLDARFSQPEEFPWTHNLSVAAPFGLSLTQRLNLANGALAAGPAALRDLQGGIAPFRDGYQTALFFATKAALEPKLLEDAKWDDPRIFEIGRTRVFDLSMTPWKDTADSGSPSVHPIPMGLQYRGFGTRGAVSMGIAFALACLTGLVPVWDRVRRLRGDKYWTIFRNGTILLLFSIALFVFLWIANDHPGGEPIALAEGVSVWPTEWVRYLAGMAGLLLLLDARETLKKTKITICRRFHFGRMDPHVLDEYDKKPWSSATSWKDPGPRSIGDIEATFPDVKLDARWRPHQTPVDTTDASSDASKQKWVFSGLVWHIYARREEKQNRRWRVGWATFAYLCFGWGLMLTFGFPHIPARGVVARGADLVLLVFSVLVLVVMTMYVVDVVQNCNKFVRHLSRARTYWPPALQRDATQRWGVEPQYLDEHLDMELIGTLTKAISGLVVYPSVILTLMLFSRNRYFDDWEWPPALLLIYAVNLAYAVYCYYALRRSSEKARAHSLERLGATLHRLDAEREKKVAEKVRTMMEEIRADRRGALQSFWRQPLVQALMLPFSVFGVWAVLQYFGTFY